jgi:ATP-dependent helicase/nuclease subunit B
MPAAPPNVFNIPASAPFLATLIDAIRGGRLVAGFPASSDPLELARATLYLPTRRACRLARDTFLERLDGDAAILPRIVALGDLDEDEIAFAQAATGELAEAALRLPPAIAPLERRLLLTQLIAAWGERETSERGAQLVANSPAAAIGLADDLARLIDDMITRGIDWKSLDDLVPEEHDRFWQDALRFLKIARDYWPARLKELNAIDATARRDALIDAEAMRLAATGAPVIAAGSTGSMPATAKLLATIAKLPQGALVLPGLDTELDEATWQSLSGGGDKVSHELGPAASHAQFAMQALLTQIGIARAEVRALAPSHGRELLISEVLRPAASTAQWQQRRAAPAFDEAASAALDSLSIIEAANADEEALAIAVALREAVETADKTAALITPDRALARRVGAALERWNVAVDDSGGDSLADTTAGVFARLAAEAAIDGLEPVTLLALLKHPLLRLHAPAGAHRAAIGVLELAILRGPRPRAGSDGLSAALSRFREDRNTLHRSDPRRDVGDAAIDAAAGLIAQLAAALAPLEYAAGSSLPLAALAQRHRGTIVALGFDAEGGIAAFAGHDGVALERALADLAASPTAAGLNVAKADYPALFHAAIAGRAVRRPELRDVRVRIFGPLEARLQAVDLAVLGGLNEGTWPGETRSDPWLSRPMRHQLGLDPPERRIGLAAHDFAQAFGAPRIILTRSAKVAGAPAVASRFVQRLAAVAGEQRWTQALARGQRYLDFARTLDVPAAVQAVERPAPAPPLAVRPRQLSVTEIEDLLRDPFTIYARHVLKLTPLDAIDMAPGAADRGTVIHDAIAEFGKTYPGALPADTVQAMIAIGKTHFAHLSEFAEAQAFWWPRFERIAEWFAPFEAGRRARLKKFEVEIGGRIEIPFGMDTFTLTVRADRIECLSDGRYAILDYKTGAPPTDAQVLAGLSPQLTLEAAILRQGGFKGIAAGASVAELVYVRLRGGAEAGEERGIVFKEGTPDTHADMALAELADVLKAFADPAKPYYSLLHPMWKNHYGTYDHLARVKEWSLSGDNDDGGGE